MVMLIFPSHADPTITAPTLTPVVKNTALQGREKKVEFDIFKRIAKKQLQFEHLIDSDCSC